MLDSLKRPLHKHYDKVRGYAAQYAVPVKDSVTKLLAMLPKVEAFAGSEDLGETGKTSGFKGFVAKFKDFKKSLKGLTDFQKLLLLTIAVVLPAGMLLSVALIGFFNRKK